MFYYFYKLVFNINPKKFDLNSIRFLIKKIRFNVKISNSIHFRTYYIKDSIRSQMFDSHTSTSNLLSSGNNSARKKCIMPLALLCTFKLEMAIDKLYEMKNEKN